MRFARSLRLPEGGDAASERVRVMHENGVLSVFVPRRSADTQAHGTSDASVWSQVKNDQMGLIHLKHILSTSEISSGEGVWRARLRHSARLSPARLIGAVVLEMKRLRSLAIGTSSLARIWNQVKNDEWPCDPYAANRHLIISTYASRCRLGRASSLCLHRRRRSNSMRMSGSGRQLARPTMKKVTKSTASTFQLQV